MEQRTERTKRKLEMIDINIAMIILNIKGPDIPMKKRLPD